MYKKKFNISLNILLSLFLMLQSIICFADDSNGDCTTITDSTQNTCYMASDFGFSTGELRVNSIDLKAPDHKTKWVKFDPVLYTEGNGDSATDNNLHNIVLRVDGGWKPWGYSTTGNCLFNTCTENQEQGCYPDGEELDKGAIQKNIPCCISDGYGLYGLIAVDGAGGPKDPNNSGEILNSTDFITFRVAPLEEGKFKPSSSGEQSSQEVTIKTFTLQNVEVWDPDSKQFKQQPIPKGGVLYFKIVDSYYPDNQGSYNIIINKGAFSKKIGLVESLMDFFIDTFHQSADLLYENIVKESGFRTVVRALLMLFVTFTVIFFMIGLIEINQTELVVRLFKIGIISTLISDTTLSVIPNLFEGFIYGASNISTIIMRDSMYDPQTGASLIPFPNLNNVFSAYDGVIEMVTSAVFNIKIWSLLFTSRLYLIIGIYLCIIIMFIGMFRSLVQYIMGFFVLALLIVILPIFLITILFKQTAGLFDTWLDQFIGACLMIIITSTIVALMLSLIISQLQGLLYYTVCWESIWKWDPLGITIIDFHFWKPDDWGQFSSAATPMSFFYVLISSILFRVYADYAPELADTLAGMAKQPLKGLYGGTSGSQNGMMASAGEFMKNNVYNTAIYKALDKNVVSPMQQRLSPLSPINWALNKTILPKDAIFKGTNLLYKGAGGVSSALFGSKDSSGIRQYGLYESFTSNPGGGLGVVDFNNEKLKGARDWKSFEEKHGKYGYQLVGKPIVYVGKGVYEGGVYAGKGIYKGGVMIRDGVYNLRQKYLDQSTQNLMRNMLAKDKVILDGRMTSLDKKYTALLEDQNKGIDGYKDKFDAFISERKLVTQEMQLYADQERGLSGGISVSLLKENADQITSILNQANDWKSEDITKCNEFIGSIARAQEDARNIQNVCDEQKTVIDAYDKIGEQWQITDAIIPSGVHVQEERDSVGKSMAEMTAAVHKSTEEIARLQNLAKALEEEMRKIK
jgi:type IV secretory pathway VirB6-like protein